jgi:hypothetical protein
MALTKCPHCDDQHVCHVGDSHQNTKAVEDLLAYIGYRAGRLARALPFAASARDIQLPARDVLALVMHEKTLDEVIAQVDEDIPIGYQPEEGLRDAPG